MESVKIKGKTPNGGDYSVITYMDDAGNVVDESVATKCVIRECKNDGALVAETYGECGTTKERNT